ncbi:hypothetical protein [Butyrivibrio sp. AE3009]|uniref:hypothetical protein n=1 Tax=Butyrivibrio sp. AE3009 TaxID=1280666 RepID=UPI0012DDA3D8|nr:hypothetical protein [Butyrivibrio sp. AE3009]
MKTAFSLNDFSYTPLWGRPLPGLPLSQLVDFLLSIDMRFEMRRGIRMVGIWMKIVISMRKSMVYIGKMRKFEEGNLGAREVKYWGF